MKLNKCSLLFLLFILLSTFAYSQNFFKAQEEETFDLFVTENVELCMELDDGFLFAGGCLSSIGVKQVLLLKTDKKGELLWQKTYGEKADYSFTNLRETPDGSFLLLMQREQDMQHAIAVKVLSGDGQVINEFEFAANENNVALDILQLNGGEIIIAGYRRIKGDNDSDGWIIQVNKKGREDWMRLLGERYMDDKLTAICTDPSGAIYVAGHVTKKVGGPVVPVVYSLDQRGNPLWTLTMDELENSQTASLSFDKSNTLIVYATRREAMGKVHSSSKAVLALSGSLLNISSVPYQLSLDRNKFYQNPDGSILVLGSETRQQGASPEFIMKLNNEFVPLWKKKVEEGLRMEALAGIDKDLYLMAGSYQEAGKSDIFVQRFKDLSPILMDSYINSKLIASGEKDGIELISAYVERVGLRKYKQLSSQYLAEAQTALNLMGESRATVSQAEVTGNKKQDSMDPLDKAQMDGKYYALLIAVNDYNDPAITDLDQPLNDARKLYDVLLNNYTFEEVNMTLLNNPTREKIIEELDRLTQVVNKNDNVLVFYAGHGYWDEKTENGYWLPTDASKQNTANWIRNSTISDYIRSIPSLHTLLIADACFSGSIFKTRAAFNNNLPLQRLNELPSRKAMTSGTLKEVPDKSVFIEFLVKRLADNSEDFLPSEQLFFSFKPAVLNNSENIPQFGVVANAEDEGGDFIFIKK